MGIKKIKKLINKELDVRYNLGWSEGYEAGLESSNLNDYEEGHSEGVQAEKSRTQDVLSFMFESAINSNQGSKATLIKQIMETLKIQINMEEALDRYDRDED
jgi:flagellar biosynthesis/type III secretory pathway protein FliH